MSEPIVSVEDPQSRRFDSKNRNDVRYKVSIGYLLII